MSDKGTSAWFVGARELCIDHLRALGSIRAAERYMAKLLEQPPSCDTELAGALHSAAVIAYSQAFTTAHTRAGKVTYKIHRLKKAVGFDKRLHRHLLDLRDRLIAHADYAVLPSVMDMSLIGDLPVALTLKVKRLAGIRSRGLAERYHRHFRACRVAIEASLNDELRELVAEGRKHPGTFRATHNIPPAEETVRISGKFEDLSPGNQVAEPTFENEGYVYISLEHCLPLVQGGQHAVTDRDGKQVEIDIEITLGQPPPTPSTSLDSGTGE